MIISGYNLNATSFIPYNPIYMQLHPFTLYIHEFVYTLIIHAYSFILHRNANTI